MTLPTPIRSLILASALAVVAAPAFADNETPVATVKNLDANVHVDILSLKRTDGATVTLQFALVNDGPGTHTLTPGNTRLIDLTARRRYEVGLEMPGGCSAEPGEKKACWVMFAAPPATTKSVNVLFYGTWPLALVPVSE
jgi:hypothetical protein